MKYFLPDDGETIEAAREPKTRTTNTNYPESYAVEIARYLHEHCDAWEWTWPIEIAVVLGDGSIKMFSVEREMQPYFSAREIKS